LQQPILLRGASVPAVPSTEVGKGKLDWATLVKNGLRSLLISTTTALPIGQIMASAITISAATPIAETRSGATRRIQVSAGTIATPSLICLQSPANPGPT
jgi:hypothetical protein